jgi:hypothetical protein
MEDTMTDGPWTTESAVDFVNRWCSAWNERRFETIAAMLDPDVFY